MSQRNLIIVPFGGLANRIRVILSAINLAQKFNLKLKVYWIEREELNCDFNYLFQPIKNVEIKTFKNGFFFKVLIKLSSHLKIFLSFFNYIVISDKYIHKFLERDYFDCNPQILDHKLKNRSNKNIFFTTCAKFYNYDNNDISLLKVNHYVQNRVNLFLEKHSLTNYISIHIRYTDNVLAINNSPLSIFESIINIELDFGRKIVICTDSEFVKNELEQKYSNILIFPETEKNRDSVIGIQDALFELIILSKANKVFGSYGSTYSLLATEIGNNPLIIVKK